MSVEGEIHAALMGHVASIPGGYETIDFRKGGDVPEGDHLRISHLPNDSSPLGLEGAEGNRRGFIFVTLVQSLHKGFDVMSQNEAGDIAEHFTRGLVLTEGATRVQILWALVKPGREEGTRWETPIRVEYLYLP